MTAARPNTSGTRGGHPPRRPIVLAPPDYDKNDEQAFRTQLDQRIAQVQLQLDVLGARVAKGSFTMAAAATKTVTDANVTSTSVILLVPTNAAAGTLQGSAKSLYVSTKTAGASFAVATASGVAAAGTETFDYVIINA